MSNLDIQIVGAFCEACWATIAFLCADIVARESAE